MLTFEASTHNLCILKWKLAKGVAIDDKGEGLIKDQINVYTSFVWYVFIFHW